MLLQNYRNKFLNLWCAIAHLDLVELIKRMGSCGQAENMSSAETQPYLRKKSRVSIVIDTTNLIDLNLPYYY